MMSMVLSPRTSSWRLWMQEVVSCISSVGLKMVVWAAFVVAVVGVWLISSDTMEYSVGGLSSNEDSLLVSFSSTPQLTRSEFVH